MVSESVNFEEIVFDKCPICKKGKIQKIKQKQLFGLFSSEDILCNECDAKFEEEGKRNQIKFRLNLSNTNQKSKYDGEALTKIEWERGTSDLDLCIKNKRPPKANIEGLHIILLPNEETHWYSDAKLMEEKSIRQSLGGAVRVMKGVYVGSSRSESHGELRTIDKGGLLLTSMRLIFNGDFRSTEFKLNKIISVQEYSDAVEIGSNRQRVQIFVVDEPKKWATYIKLAIQNYRK